MAGRFRFILRWALGATFLVAGTLKVFHPADFYSDLLAYDVALPDFVFRLIAVAFPWLEVISGGALLADFWPETVRALTAGLCFVFVLMLGQAVLRDLDLQCGCFGDGAAGWTDRPLVALARAGLLLGGALWLLRQPSSTRSAPASASGHNL
jgi:putative oxidoreductase